MEEVEALKLWNTEKEQEDHLPKMATWTQNTVARLKVKSWWYVWEVTMSYELDSNSSNRWLSSSSLRENRSVWPSPSTSDKPAVCFANKKLKITQHQQKHRKDHMSTLMNIWQKRSGHASWNSTGRLNQHGQ